MNIELSSEEWNYEAKIVPRDKIHDTLINNIINNANKFICLITPYWTRGAVNKMRLIPLLKKKQESGVNVYLLGEDTEDGDYHQNLSILKSFFNKHGINNCWLVKDLHSKLYYNEHYILLNSANNNQPC